MDAVNHQYQKNNKKLSKVLSTKLSIEDYNAFLTLTKLEYQAGLIKEESTSELRYWVGIVPYSYHNIQNTISVPITQRSFEVLLDIVIILYNNFL